jgi:hypothetical protein
VDILSRDQRRDPGGGSGEQPFEETGQVDTIFGRHAFIRPLAKVMVQD